MGRPREIKDSDIIELHGEGCMDIEMGEILGYSPQAIMRRRQSLGLPKNETHRRDAKRYAVYLRKTTEFITEGTIREIALYMNRSEHTLRSYICRQNKGEEPYYELVEVEGWTRKEKPTSA